MKDTHIMKNMYVYKEYVHIPKYIYKESIHNRRVPRAQGIPRRVRVGHVVAI